MFWKDDLLQLRWSSSAGGATSPSLTECQRNSRWLGASEAGGKAACPLGPAVGPSASHLTCPVICTLSGGLPYAPGMRERVGYARCSLDKQDLTMAVPKLGRLAHSASDARDIRGSLTARGVKLSLCGTLVGLADLFSVSRAAFCRVLERCQSSAARPSSSAGW